MRLLVTGASGLLGLHLSMQAALQHEVVGVVNAHPLTGVAFPTITADLSSEGQFDRLVEQVNPDAIIHTAALAFPETCEEAPERSVRVNAELPGWVAAAARKRGVPLLHMSTDAIFDGLRGDYTEEDTPNPLNTYARHKLAGEQAVHEIYPEAIVVRSVFYGWTLSGRRSLAEWFFNNLSAGNLVNGFTDAFFCPLEAGELGKLLVRMIEQGLSGVYHVASVEAISKYHFGNTIAGLFHLDQRLITPASVNDSDLKAARAANLSLNCEKLIRDLGIRPPDQMTGLRKFHQQWCDGLPERINAFGCAENPA